MERKTWPDKKEKLEELADAHDLTVDELLEQATSDSVAPGICMRRGCDFIAEYEPDQDEGWCDECKTPTVVSALILSGLV